METRDLNDRRKRKFRSLNTSIDAQIAFSAYSVVDQMSHKVGRSLAFFSPPCAGIDNELVANRSGFWNEGLGLKAFEEASGRHKSPGMHVDVGSFCFSGDWGDDPSDGLGIGLPVRITLHGLPIWELNGDWLSLVRVHPEEAKVTTDIAKHPAFKPLEIGWRGCLEAAGNWLFGNVEVVDGHSHIIEPKEGLRDDEKFEVPPLEKLSDLDTTHRALMEMICKRYRLSWRRCAESNWDVETYKERHSEGRDW